MIAFVLVKLAAGLEQKVLSQIRQIKGVKDVYLTFGGWDAILTSEADTIDKLSGLVVREVRAIPGVQSTETLVTTNI